MEELLNSELAVIHGGEISEKSRNIGIVLTIISPIAGAGCWFGYYVNSWWIMLFVTISLCLISIAYMIKNKKLKYTLFIFSILISILSMVL